MASEKHFKYVILGGGVAAVCSLASLIISSPLPLFFAGPSDGSSCTLVPDLWITD
jgi:hypothetical protein